VLEDVYEEAIVSGHITLKGIMHRQLRLEVLYCTSRRHHRCPPPVVTWVDEGQQFCPRLFTSGI